MINLPSSHSDPLAIGVGAHRVCYIHPDDPKKCIKVIYKPDDEIAKKEIRRELAYYRHLNTYLKDWRGMTRYHGEVETNLGTGYVYDRVMDFDGKISQTITDRYKIENLKDNWQELATLVDTLEKYMWDNRIITMALKPHNVLCQRISENEIFPVICDNIGIATRIPVVLYCPWLCHRKQKKLFAKFEHQPLMQALRKIQRG